MEYLRYRGVYRDIPLERMLAELTEFYGPEVMARWRQGPARSADFEREAEAG